MTRNYFGHDPELFRMTRLIQPFGQMTEYCPHTFELITSLGDTPGTQTLFVRLGRTPSGR